MLYILRSVGFHCVHMRGVCVCRQKSILKIHLEDSLAKLKKGPGSSRPTSHTSILKRGGAGVSLTLHMVYAMGG